MCIITLTTDFGIKDYFTAAIKGAIYKELKEVKIVDVTHNISPFNIAEAAYLVKNAYPNFPDKSIHIIGVDSELTPNSKHLAFKLNNQYFICADNGFISLLTPEVYPEEMVEISIHNLTNNSCFPELDVFVKIACHIARGGSLDVVGKKRTEYKKITQLQAIVSADKSTIKGNVIYTDNLGNIVTNITKKLFNETGANRPFEIFAGKYRLKKIYEKYSDIEGESNTNKTQQKDGSKLAVFNSANHLEIAIYRSNLDTFGGASSLLGLYYRDAITIKFM